jgi:ketosteroid isomerase-like protein
MRTAQRSFAMLAVLVACTAPSPQPATSTASIDATARKAFDNYVAAINSNNLDSLMGMLTDSVVFLSPNEPALVGKAAVRPWGDAYLKAYHIHWDKTSQEFTMAGEWAFERYSYRSTDTPRAGGAAAQDAGKGLVIYHRDPDGKWRVARDAWSSDLKGK